MPRRNLPPLRVCAGCGAEHRAFSAGAPCHRCRTRQREESLSLAELAAEQRAGRRQETLDRVGQNPETVPYNEFPPGF